MTTKRKPSARKSKLFQQPADYPAEAPRQPADQLLRNSKDGMAALGMMQNAELISRAMLQARLGMQFYGERDLYAAFGYPIMPTYLDYRAHYDRQGIATRAIEIFSDDTWRNAPAIIDGVSRSDIDDGKQTPFIKEFNALAKRLQIWQMFRQADIMCGIGRFSILFMGAPGDYSHPAEDGGLFYLAAFDEQQTTIGGWIDDNKSEKFGMPLKYSINFNAINNGVISIPESGAGVHYSRVLHISENRLGNRVYGRPRLQTILNNLYDLEKIVGGASESVWLSMYKGLIFTGRDGSSMPAEDTPEGQNLLDQIQNYVHRLQRYMILENADVKDMGTANIDVEHTYDMLISNLAGSIGVPKRILIGSERGELASSQDLRTWNGVIETRRTNFAEPEILDPFLTWCMTHKVLPPPASGKYRVDWKPVFALNEIEQSEMLLKISQGAQALTSANSDATSIISGDEFRAFIKLPRKSASPQEDRAAIEAEQTALESESGVGTGRSA